MAQCLSYFCDTPQTQQLMSMYGDRLQRMERADLIDFVTVFSAACNSDDCEETHRAGDLISLLNILTIEITSDLEAALDEMDHFDRGNELNLLFGLAAMLADRSEGQ